MTGEFNGLIILGVLWFILSRITSSGRNRAGRAESRPPNLPRQLSGRPDATQQEGLRLDTLLRDLQRSLEQAGTTTRPGNNPGQPARSPGAGQLPAADSEARSLEDDAQLEGRRLVDLDDEAAEVETRRIQAAEARKLPQARGRPLAQEQIKAQPAEHTAAHGYSAKQLRDAVIWREILGPPVSER